MKGKLNWIKYFIRYIFKKYIIGLKESVFFFIAKMVEKVYYLFLNGVRLNQTINIITV